MTVNVKEAPYFAGTGGVDDTAAIQAALNDHYRIFIPAGIYRIDPSVGLVLRTGNQIVGEGRGATILHALPGGGSIAQLAAYGGGSILRRAFDPNDSNAYVTDVVLRDFGVVLTHPTDSITATAIQIGIDLRNITRSIVERVHVGNIAPENVILDKPKAISREYEVQGYGIVIGNVSSGTKLPNEKTPYAGGEVNTIRNCAVWGAYKLITQDDGDLSPLSGAHATTIDTCDLQLGHHILVQESRYATGNAWRGNTLQAVLKQPGNPNRSFLLRVEGYNNHMADGYIEGQDRTGGVPQLDYFLYLGNSSQNNRIALPYFAYSSLAAQMVDNGRRNIVTGYEAEPQFTDHDGNPATPPVETSKASFGPAFTLYDGAHAEPWVKFHWDGAQVVIDGGQGASVVRVGVGDYLVNWDKPFRSNDYALSASLNTNTSGHPGSITLGSQTEANARFYTYIDAGCPLAQADPQFLYVSAKNG